MSIQLYFHYYERDSNSFPHVINRHTLYSFTVSIMTFTSETAKRARRIKGARHAHATIRASGRVCGEEARAAPRAHRKVQKQPCQHCAGVIARPRSIRFCSRECQHEHTRIRKYKGRRNQDADARFWSRVTIGNEHECWLWTGRIWSIAYGKLYGRFTTANGKPGGMKWYAHRYAWTSINGTIPAHLQIDHICANKLCCNPAHMQLLTVSDHMKEECKRRKLRQS